MVIIKNNLELRRLKCYVVLGVNHMKFCFDAYEMRLIREEDVDAYYLAGFETPDNEANYYTGTSTEFTKEQVTAYIKRIVHDDKRFDFIIIKDQEIVGEIVLNEFEGKVCNYRICLFNKSNFSKGIGYKGTQLILDWAFKTLPLDAITLEVYPFNKRGLGLYRKLGFEFVDEYYDDEAIEPYCQVIKMKINHPTLK